MLLCTAGSLVSEREMLPGLSYLTIKIDKFGVKDPQNHLDPFFTISVKSKKLFYGENDIVAIVIQGPYRDIH